MTNYVGRWSSYIRTRSFSTIQHNFALIRPQNISPLTDWPVKVLFSEYHTIPYMFWWQQWNFSWFPKLSLNRLRNVSTHASIWSSLFVSTVAGLNESFFFLLLTNLSTNKLDMAGFLPRVAIFFFFFWVYKNVPNLFIWTVEYLSYFGIGFEFWVHFFFFKLFLFFSSVQCFPRPIIGKSKKTRLGLVCSVSAY